MKWISSALERLAREPICGYLPNQSAASEPTALAALALAGSSYHAPAQRAAEWLAELQSPEGSIGVRRDAPRPRWPTALAVLAWQTMGGVPNGFASHIEKANAWSLSIYGERMEPNENVGHKSMLSAWPWVQGTHSWVEPTALHVLALKASGLAQHPRTREAVELLIDRQLPDGGCNYGNTIVMGTVLRPHVQPTGMAMLALAGEPDSSGRVNRSLAYLEGVLSEQTTPASLGWAVMGLTAHGRRPSQADAWLQRVATQSKPDRLTALHFALLVLASLGEHCPLMPTAVRSTTHSILS